MALSLIPAVRHWRRVNSACCSVLTWFRSSGDVGSGGAPRMRPSVSGMGRAWAPTAPHPEVIHRFVPTLGMNHTGVSRSAEHGWDSGVLGGHQRDDHDEDAEHPQHRVPAQVPLVHQGDHARAGQARDETPEVGLPRDPRVEEPDRRVDEDDHADPGGRPAEVPVEHQQRAEQAEHCTRRPDHTGGPGPDRVGGGRRRREQQEARGPAHRADQEEHEVAEPAQQPFQVGPDLPQDQQVEHDVQEHLRRVQERGRQSAPRLAGPGCRREREPLEDLRTDQLGDVDDDADRHDRVGHDGPARVDRTAEDCGGGTALPRALVNAVDALDPDRCGPLTLRADGPSTPLAAHVRLAIGVPRAYRNVDRRLVRGGAGHGPGRTGMPRARFRSALAVDRDALDDDVVDRLVTAVGRDPADLVDDLTARPVGDLAEDRVLAVEVRGGADGDEELGAVGALSHPLAGVGHGEEVGLVELLVRVDLVVVLVARAARTAAQRVAALDHEPADDAVEDQPVEERRGVRAAGVVAVLPLTRRESHEAVDRLGRLVREERDDDVALVGVEGCLHGGHPFTQSTRGFWGMRRGRRAGSGGLVSCPRGKHGRMGRKSNERSAGQTHSGGTVFAQKKQPTVSDYVDVVREQASTAADKGLGKGSDLAQAYGPKAKVQAQAAADAAAAAARTYGPIARDKATEAYEAARPRVEEVYRERLDPYVQEARRRAEPYVERAVQTAAPRVQQAVENLEPKVDKAHEVIVDAWIPRISAAIA